MVRTIMFCGIAALMAGFAATANAAPTADATAACAATGLNPSEAPFAHCVANLREQSQPRIATDDNAMKAQRSCALLGYDPAGAQFASCVGNVEQTLFDQAAPQS